MHRLDGLTERRVLQLNRLCVIMSIDLWNDRCYIVAIFLTSDAAGDEFADSRDARRWPEAVYRMIQDNGILIFNQDLTGWASDDPVPTASQARVLLNNMHMYDEKTQTSKKSKRKAEASVVFH